MILVKKEVKRMDNRTIEEVRRNEDRLIDKNIILEKENEELKIRLNHICFSGDHTAEVETALRYLKKIGYVGFDDEKQIYINKQYGVEGFIVYGYDERREKAFFIEEDKLDDYTKQLEEQVKRLKQELYEKIEKLEELEVE